MNLIKKYIPFFNWISTYNKAMLTGDIVAGLTVGIMLIPQGMAYALLAGLPPVYGLYAALVPQVVYAFLGTSRQLAVGPVAMDSLLVATIVSALAVNPDNYIELALLLAMMMGALQLLFGIFKFGFLVNFLSKPVISAFTFAAALIIGLNQIKHLLGISFDKFILVDGVDQKVKTSTLHELGTQIYLHIGETNLVALIIGVIGVIVIKLIKKFIPKVPAALIVVIVGIVVVYFFRLDNFGVKIVKEIPQGLPHIGLPRFNLESFQALIPAAFTLALIAFMEAISVAKAIEERHDDYKVDPNQELIALGASNFIGSFFSSYPVTGGFSRSAVSDQAGAKTGVAAIISALLILLTLLFLTEYFYYLPNALLGSIIMVAVFGLIDIKVPKQLWKTDKIEFAIYLVTFLSTLFIGIQQGIGIGVLLSLIMVIYNVSYPHIAVVGKIKGTNEYRNIERYESLEIANEFVIVRIDARLFYANMNVFRDKVMSLINVKHKTKAVIIVGKAINGIDSSSIQMLINLIDKLKNENIRVYFSGIKGPIEDKLKKSGEWDVSFKDKCFLSIDAAIAFHKAREINNK
jgi:SulP family sulfate permease